MAAASPAPVIYVASSWSDAYAPLAAITWDGSKVPYAKAHGYRNLHRIHAPETDLMWDRPAFWLKALNTIHENDWLFFSGADAIITRPELPLEAFLPADTDFFCGLDHYVIHGDVWALRSCEATKTMLQSILANRGPTEQHAFIDYLSAHPHQEFPALVARDKTGITQAFISPGWFKCCERLLNASPVRVKLFNPSHQFSSDDMHIHPHGTVPEGLRWTPQYFMLHMGGKSLEYRIANIGKYVQKDA